MRDKLSWGGCKYLIDILWDKYLFFLKNGIIRALVFYEGYVMSRVLKCLEHIRKILENTTWSNQLNHRVRSWNMSIIVTIALSQYLLKMGHEIIMFCPSNFIKISGFDETLWEIIKAIECSEIKFEIKDKVCLNLWIEHLKDKIPLCIKKVEIIC